MLKCEKCEFDLRVIKRPSSKTGFGEILFCPKCGAEYLDRKFVKMDEDRYKTSDLALYG